MGDREGMGSGDGMGCGEGEDVLGWGSEGCSAT